MIVLIPCKRLSEAKSRLAPCLSLSDRRNLCLQFLKHTLSLVMALAPAAQVYLVTADGDAADLGARYGADYVPDRGIDMNSALTAAREEILHRVDGDRSILIMPIDLPFATAGSIERIVEYGTDVVIVPDRHRQGTNILLLSERASRTFPFRFGPGSFINHCAEAESRNQSITIADDEDLMFDIDTPDDYRRALEKKA